MTRQQLLADVTRQSRAFAERFFKGFDDTNHTAQPAGLPNHFAWTLGHVSLTLNACARHLDGRDLPVDQFGPTSDSTSRPRCYDPRTLGFGSRPIGDPLAYPDCSRCVEVFATAVERLASAVESADDTMLDKLVPWGGQQIPLRMAVSRNALHVALHAGQITDLRRALGLAPVLG